MRTHKKRRFVGRRSTTPLLRSPFFCVVLKRLLLRSRREASRCSNETKRNETKRNDGVPFDASKGPPPPPQHQHQHHNKKEREDFKGVRLIRFFLQRRKQIQLERRPTTNPGRRRETESDQRRRKRYFCLLRRRKVNVFLSGEKTTTTTTTHVHSRAQTSRSRFQATAIGPPDWDFWRADGVEYHALARSHVRARRHAVGRRHV